MQGAKATENIEEEIEEDINEMRKIMEQTTNSSRYNTTINTQAHTFSPIQAHTFSPTQAHTITPTHIAQTSTSYQTFACQPTRYSHTMPQNTPDISFSQYNVPQHTYDKYIEMQHKTYYTNSYHSQFQVGPLPTEQPGQLHQIRPMEGY